MNPRWLFPILAVLFAMLAWRAQQRPAAGGRARTWWLLALSFAAVSAWLHLAATAPDA